MFKIHAIQAAFGDCLLLECGSAAEPLFMLIDGGPKNIFSGHLKKVLKDRLAASGGKLDRVVLSHVDTDHVTGLLDLVAELRRQRADDEDELATIGGLWHNSFDATLDPNGTLAPKVASVLAMGAAAMTVNAEAAILGISEGDQLRRAADAHGIAINPDLAEPIFVDSAPNPIQLGTMSLTVVGPTKANLEALREAWEVWLDKHQNAIASGDAQIMANSDRSVPNLSSICFVAEANGKTMLLTGDQRSDFLLEGLEAQGLLDDQGRAHFDLIKLPHHGSDRNVTRKFFERVTADIYLVSADGTNGNPDLPTLLWLVDSAHVQGRQVKIYATNKTTSIRELLEVRPPDNHHYSLSVLPAGKSSMEIALA